MEIIFSRNYLYKLPNYLQIAEGQNINSET